MLPRRGLCLPTEAEWEYAARAGTTTPWSTGPTRETLQGYANVADSFARRERKMPWDFEETLRDSHIAHAPVGSYAANGFGLHDVHGDVWE